MIQLYGSQVTEEGARRLQSLLPKCAVLHPALPMDDGELKSAQWVIDSGGSVSGHWPPGQYEQLPPQPFFLREVDLRKADSELGDWTSLTGIRSLEGLLSPSGLVNADLKLESVRSLTSLRTLHIEGSDVSATGLRHLSELSELEQIFLNNCVKLTDDALEHLSSFEHLWLLHLLHTPITGDGLRHLGQLQNLHYLILDGCTELNEDNLKHLLTLPRLRRLHLSSWAITDAAIPHLEQMKTLRILYLMKTQVTADAAARLQAALPDCVVFHESLNYAPWQPSATSP